MELTQQEFTAHVPAAIEPTGQVWKKVQQHIAAATRYVERQIVGPYFAAIESGSHIDTLTRRAICLQAFADAVPTLDLVLTANGFGITNGQNIAPASKERVERLLTSVRTDYDTTVNELIVALYEVDEWTQTMADRLIRFVLWEVSDFRAATGRINATRSDLLAAYPAMQNADTMIAHTISSDYLAELLQKVRRRTLTQADLRIVPLLHEWYGLAVCRQPLKAIAETTLRTIDQHLADYPTYTASTEYAARKTPRYENQQQHATFFWN